MVYMYVGKDSLIQTPLVQILILFDFVSRGWKIWSLLAGSLSMQVVAKAGFDWTTSKGSI